MGRNTGGLEMREKIDFVVTYLDGTDSEWIKEKINMRNQL